jgi:FHA domain-containing protein
MTDTHEARLPSPRELKALIETERTGLPFVHWRDGAGEQHIMMLTDERLRVTIGRRELSDIPLTWDTKVSRAHALLEPVGDEWTLVDDGLSRNGSWINGSRIHGRQRLHDGDSMCFGDSRVYYRQPGSARGSESTARAPGTPSGVPVSETQRRVLIALCRPIANANSETPATNPRIAEEVHLSVDAVKAHLRMLFERFGLSDLPQNEKRSRLVSIVLSSGVLAPHDF